MLKKKFFKNLDFTDYKKGDIYIMIFFTIYPLIYYIHKLVPSEDSVFIFGFEITAGGFSSVHVFLWVLMTKLLSLTTFTILLIRIKSAWSYFLIIPFTLYFFHLVVVLNKKFKSIDELNFFAVLPFVIIGLYLIYRYKKYVIYNNEKRNFQYNQKLLSLKNKALNAQMNPHFITNLTMSLQNTIAHNDITKTRESLIKFNRLTNLILRSTKSNLISLEEELNICSLYLDLQVFRFNDFKYSLSVNGIDEEELEFIKVPPMIIQPLVENVFKHGIRGNEEKGNIEININVQDDIIQCTIVDNGRGTDKNRNTFTDQYSGISIPNIKERLSMFGKVMDLKIDNLLLLENRKDKKGNVIGFQTNLNIPILSI